MFETERQEKDGRQNITEPT